VSLEAYPHAEKDVAKRFGLPQEKIRDVRAAELERGRDWTHTRGAVHYSADGLDRLRAALQMPEEAAPAAPAENVVVVVHGGSGEGKAGILRQAAEQQAAIAPDLAELGAARARLLLQLEAREFGLGMYLAQRAARAAKNSAEPAAAEVAPPLEAGEVRELVVLRVYSLNRRIVLARFGEIEARVRVRDNRKLQPGMKMRCSYVERDLWDLEQRLPRHPGKW
jgi:hypothetical protein